MDEKVRIINAEVRWRGDAELDLRHGAPAWLVAIMLVSGLSSLVAIGFAATSGERWPISFALFMTSVTALARAAAWKGAAKRLAAALLMATDNGRALRPVRRKGAQDGARN